MHAELRRNSLTGQRRGDSERVLEHRDAACAFLEMESWGVQVGGVNGVPQGRPFRDRGSLESEASGRLEDGIYQAGERFCVVAFEK